MCSLLTSCSSRRHGKAMDFMQASRLKVVAYRRGQCGASGCDAPPWVGASQRREVAVWDALVLVKTAVGGGGEGEAHHRGRPGGGAHRCLPAGAAVLAASVLRVTLLVS